MERHFYVDDGLICLPSPTEAIDLLQRTQASLAESNLCLHKFASNSQAVMQAFCPEDCAAVVKDLDLSGEETQLQRSLGLIWETMTDTFTFSVATTDKPFTRRGFLSSVNSVFDPMGLLATVTIQGRALLRELTSENSDWDTTSGRQAKQMGSLERFPQRLKRASCSENVYNNFSEPSRIQRTVSLFGRFNQRHRRCSLLKSSLCREQSRDRICHGQGKTSPPVRTHHTKT